MQQQHPNREVTKRKNRLIGQIIGFKKYLNNSTKPSGIIIKLLQKAQNELHQLKEENAFIHVDEENFK